jgi:hypothetical protein
MDSPIESLTKDQFEALSDEIMKRITKKIPVLRRLLTVAQAAVYLSHTEAEVQGLIDSKEFPVVREDDQVYLDMRTLDTWVDKHTT